jgi:hypothetical protein
MIGQSDTIDALHFMSFILSFLVPFGYGRFLLLDIIVLLLDQQKKN